MCEDDPGFDRIRVGRIGRLDRSNCVRRRRGVRDARLLALPLLASALCALPVDSAAGADSFPFERIAHSGLPAEPGRGLHKPFDVLAADMDLDGDSDLLINWHHRGLLELYENRDGTFVRSNPPGDDRSGVFDNRGVANLFEAADAMRSRIEASGKSGLFVWHDRNRAGSWRLLWKPTGNSSGLRLQLEASLDIAATTGLAAGEVTAIDGRRLLISIAKGQQTRSFGVRVPRVATQLVIRPVATPDSEPPTVYVGAELEPMAPGEVELWKPDPHGIAWVDVEGSPHPELFFTRGALAGELRPPARPKEDRFYIAHPVGAPSDPPHETVRYERAGRGVVPENYARGRRVEWVDVDGDGRLDLSISNEKTPNVVLVREADGYRDRAGDWALDFVDGATQMWGDLDADGHSDLFYLEGNRIHVMRNRSGGEFDFLRADALGLVLPEAAPGLEIIKSTSLQQADFDNDGDLDLWVLGYGGEMAIQLFRNDGGRYANVSQELGLAAARGARVVVLVDVDNDGFVDAVSFGQQSVLWRNLAGGGFRAEAFPADVEPGPTFAATRLDVDGDGNVDLVSAGRHRVVLRNVSDMAAEPPARTNRYLDVTLHSRGKAIIGALVRAHYSDGSIRAQRWGATQSTAYSQAVGPLHFGIRKGVSIRKVGVLWPGASSEVLVDVGDSGSRMTISREDSGVE